ncbi:MAG: RdgB/HAM1 family non-canonical purine NTP pyrophosphatase [Alphaproteobacteria bacterium]|nr:RdgB/HAM1 family non-canonical purine NTP pyrophosphatase [Alphaproteobacteria bacterium]
MTPLFAEKKLVIATHNAGKVKEFAVLINQDGLHLLSAGELNLPEPEETGLTFAENALLKSRAAASAAQLPALADDSGLSIDALDGQPGIYSARWMKETGEGAVVPSAGSVVRSTEASHQQGTEQSRQTNPAFQKIQTMLEEKNINPNGATASFIAVLALTLPSGKTYMAEGKITGQLCFPPRGDHGHGYDPIFIPDGDTRTFAEMTMDEKNNYSHRARAVLELKKQIG